MIVKHSSATQILEVARRQGLKLMREDGWAKVIRGMSSVEEVSRVTKSI
jgi:type IV pilus assembly protein PilB